MAVIDFPDVTLHVGHVKPSPTIQLDNAKALKKVNDRYDITTVALKTFTFRAVSKFVSIDNSVLGILPKHRLFALFRNAVFTGLKVTNPYLFKHFKLNHFVM